MLSFSPEKNTITCIYLFFSPIITCPHPTKRPNQQQGQGLIITPHGSSSLKKKVLAAARENKSINGE
jgi:hypothetical protein